MVARRGAWGYVVAILAVGVAAAVRGLLHSVFDIAFPFLTFFASIAIAAWFGGLKPGLLATLLSALIAATMFIDDDGAWTITTVNLVATLLFCGIGAAISAICESQHRAVERLQGEVRDRIHAEAEQREMRRLLDIGNQAAGHGTFVWHIPTDEVMWQNPRMYEIFGRTAEQGPLNKAAALRDVVHPDCIPAVTREIAAALAERRRMRVEFRIRRGHEWRWLEQLAETEYDAEGRPTRMVGVITDITPRRAADEVLRDSERQLRLVTDSAPVLIVHCDPETRYKFVNKAYADRYGKTPQEIVGQRIVEVVGEKAYAAFSHYVETALGGEPVEFETDIPYTFGTRFMHVAYTPERDANGRVQGIVCAIMDITKHRQVEDALRRSEERFRLAAEAVNGIIYEYDLASDAVVRTRGLFEVTGYRNDEVPPTGTWWREQIHAEDLAANKGNLAEAARGGRGVVTRYRVRHKDGHWLHVEDRGMVMLGPDGHPAKIIGCTTDVSDLYHQAEELRDADRRKDIFLATLAHELRNPLAPLRNGLQVMKLSGVNGHVEEARVMMDRQLTQLVRLVDDLLDVSRITRGKLDLRRDRVALRDVVDAAVETVRNAIESAGHHLTIDLPSGDVHFEGDATRIAQVFANLLHNSAKYTHPGGRISLSARTRADELEIRVRDTGIGIPPEMLNTIFDMFIQVDRRLEKTTGGLGIGLSLVKGLVEMHGGTISARSEGEGHGSEFAVTLPLATSLGSVSTAGAGPGLQNRRAT